jgi:hypothetical protein
MNNSFGISPSTSSRHEQYYQNKYPHIEQIVVGNEPDVRATASVYWGKGWNIDFQSGNPFMGTFTIDAETDSSNNIIQYGSGSYVTVNWSMHYKPNQKELLYCNAAEIPWIVQLTGSQIASLERDFSNSPAAFDTGGNMLYPSCLTDGTTPATSQGILWNSASAAVYALHMQGFRTVPISVPILRQEIVVPKTYPLAGYDVYMGRIFSVATLTTNASVPANWAACLGQPNDPTAISSYGVSIPYLYGWLQQPSTKDGHGSTITVQREWEFGLWPQNVYGTRL